MGFIAQDPRSFTRAGIEWLNPDQHGVYGIYRSNAWIYVGKGDIRARLLDHFNGDNACILREGPTHYLCEVTRNADSREKELIVELAPICNKRIG